VIARIDRVTVLCLAPAALLAVAGWLDRWVNEDGYIYLRIADNVLAGNGPVFNAGERVEAYTGALWLAIVSLLGGLTRSFLALEQLMVVLGLLFSVGGLAAAALGGLRIARARGAGTRVAPLGALVVAALPPFWDYATSGLETGLAVGWLGASFLVLTRWIAPGTGPRGAVPAAVLIGLGPLVRPDLAVFAFAFGLALVALARPTVGGALRLGSPRWRSRSPIRSFAWGTSAPWCPTPRSPRRRARRSGAAGRTTRSTPWPPMRCGFPCSACSHCSGRSCAGRPIAAC